MTVATAIYGFVLPFADFNATHALNPLWPGQARYHVVWEVIITFWLAVLGLYLLWTKSAEREASLHGRTHQRSRGTTKNFSLG